MTSEKPAPYRPSARVAREKPEDVHCILASSRNDTESSAGCDADAGEEMDVRSVGDACEGGRGCGAGPQAARQSPTRTCASRRRQKSLPTAPGDSSVSLGGIARAPAVRVSP